MTTPAADAAVPMIDHAGLLEDLPDTPAYLMPLHEPGTPQVGRISCSFCGVGDSGTVERTAEGAGAQTAPLPDGPAMPVSPYQRHLTIAKETIKGTLPTTGCIKLKHSTVRQKVAYPIHVAPSVLDRATGKRHVITYTEAIERLSDMMLNHRAPAARTLVYASGQLDYFAIFAMQEVLRLLGVRNLTGNAEHCLNAGAVHNEILTGQEGPFLTIDQAVNGPGRFYLFNGWNGFVSHPPVFNALAKRPDLDTFLIDVMVTESAKVVAKQLGKERVLLIRPRGDPHLALGVAHAILTRHPAAVHTGFLERFVEPGTFERFRALALSPQFAPERVGERIAAEPEYVPRITHAILLLAAKMAAKDTIPINIPSVGLSQSSGVVAHCLWGGVMAMVGKYGIAPNGTPLGGTLRIPGQINAESEVQGLSRKYFMGRIPMSEAADAARRMDLPGDAYQACVKDTARAALDYSDETPGVRELFLCMGTQFEANMIGRKRWIAKLTDPSVRLVVVDPIPDPFTERHADLIIPAPPHPATAKLYQNGEWKLTLSVPQKRQAPETRSDATILYDMMATITRRLETEPALAAAHPDLARHERSGYLRRRFCPPGPGAPVGGLTRIEGEISRPELWDRVMAYMSGGRGPLYCRFDHADGRPILWTELLQKGAVYYGGVGSTRFVLDYDDPGAAPFADIYRSPGKFKFFVPTPGDIEIPEGVVLNTGRSSLSDERERIAFATSTFNSGKATPIVNMPDEHPLHVPPALAERHGLVTGGRARVVNRINGSNVELPVLVTDRVKGNTVYVSFHKSRAQMERGVYVNDATDHLDRCAYSAQTRVKATPVHLERVAAQVAVGSAPGRRLDTTHIDPAKDMPIWSGQETLLHVTDVLQETHDVYTFRFAGDPLCRFVYKPGQFCSLVLNIDGKKVVRSYSISSTPTRPYVLEITVKRVPQGMVSNWLPDNVKVGDKIEIAGPKGKFCLEPGKIPKKILMLGAGSGITPLMAMARWLCDVSADVDVKFFNCVRSPDDVIFDKEIEMLTARYKMFAPVVVTSTRGGRKGWTGMTGRISRPMLEMVAPDILERHVYMCGPEGFAGAAKNLLAEMKFDLAHLHYESFGGVRTSVAQKIGQGAPAPAPGAGIGGPAGGYGVLFAQAGKMARSDGKLPLLDLAEAHDVDLPYGCRAGSCGDCKVKLIDGEVDMPCDDGLSPAEKKAGYVLSCVAVPKTDCVLDA